MHAHGIGRSSPELRGAVAILIEIGRLVQAEEVWLEGLQGAGGVEARYTDCREPIDEWIPHDRTVAGLLAEAAQAGPVRIEAWGGRWELGPGATAEAIAVMAGVKGEPRAEPAITLRMETSAEKLDRAVRRSARHAQVAVRWRGAPARQGSLLEGALRLTHIDGATLAVVPWERGDPAPDDVLIGETPMRWSLAGVWELGAKRGLRTVAAGSKATDPEVIRAASWRLLGRHLYAEAEVGRGMLLAAEDRRLLEQHGRTAAERAEGSWRGARARLPLWRRGERAQHGCEWLEAEPARTLRVAEGWDPCTLDTLQAALDAGAGGRGAGHQAITVGGEALAGIPWYDAMDTAEAVGVRIKAGPDEQARDADALDWSAVERGPGGLVRVEQIEVDVEGASPAKAHSGPRRIAAGAVVDCIALRTRGGRIEIVAGRSAARAGEETQEDREDRAETTAWCIGAVVGGNEGHIQPHQGAVRLAVWSAICGDRRAREAMLEHTVETWADRRLWRGRTYTVGLDGEDGAVAREEDT